MSKKVKFNEKDLGVNPLINSDFVIRVRKRRSVKRMVEVATIKQEEDYIDYGDVSEIENIITVEEDSYTKVFNRSCYRLHIFSLSSRARDLFLWLAYELDPAKDYLWLNKDRYRLESGVSDNTLRSAITDLIKAAVIVKAGVKDVYWINPVFFFNGSRKNKYPDHVEVVR